MVPKPFKNYYDGKCSHSTFFIPKAKTVTQIRPDDQNKGKRKAQTQQPKAVTLVPTPTNSVLKHNFVLKFYYCNILQN